MRTNTSKYTEQCEQTYAATKDKILSKPAKYAKTVTRVKGSCETWQRNVCFVLCAFACSGVR